MQSEPIRRFDSQFTTLWERLAPKFDLAIRRDAPYLNWRYIEPPHVRYSIVALKRQGDIHGYAVYRHRHEPLGRVTMLVDFLVDPDDLSGLKTLLRWVDRAARTEDSDKVRCYVMNGAFRRTRMGELVEGKKRVTLEDVRDPLFWIDTLKDLALAVLGFIPRLIVAGLFLIFFWLIYRALRRLPPPL